MFCLVRYCCRVSIVTSRCLGNGLVSPTGLKTFLRRRHADDGQVLVLIEQALVSSRLKEFRGQIVLSNCKKCRCFHDLSDDYFMGFVDTAWNVLVKRRF